MKKLLIIAYYFPPDAAVGALRPQKFAKYLPEFGWRPYVLTIKERHIERQDRERLADVQGVSVTRTSVWRTPLQVAVAIRNRLFGGKRALTADAPASAAAHAATEAEARPNALSLVKRFLLSLNCLPDDKMYWIIPAVIEGYKLVKKHDIGSILATAPPHSASIAGYLLSRLTGARLIVDYRDPWTTALELKPQRLRSGLSDMIERAAERAVVRRADRVITTTELFNERLRREYPWEVAEKFATIHNGYDQNDLQLPAERRDNGTFVISYIGSLYHDRNPEHFLSGLGSFIRKNGLSSESIQTRFIGDARFAACGALAAAVARHGLSDYVTLREPVPHREALKYMHESDLLLVFAPNWYYQIPAKVFEYLAAGRPILALADDGATADLIAREEVGAVVRQDDVRGIEDALEKLYSDRYHERDRSRDMARFERRNLTYALAQVLESIT